MTKNIVRAEKRMRTRILFFMNGHAFSAGRASDAKSETAKAYVKFS